MSVERTPTSSRNNVPPMANASVCGSALMSASIDSAAQSMLHERLRGSRAGGVDGASDEFLAGAGFAAHQHLAAVSGARCGLSTHDAYVRRAHADACLSTS